MINWDAPAAPDGGSAVIALAGDQGAMCRCWIASPTSEAPSQLGGSTGKLPVRLLVTRYSSGPVRSALGEGHHDPHGTDAAVPSMEPAQRGRNQYHAGPAAIIRSSGPLPGAADRYQHTTDGRILPCPVSSSPAPPTDSAVAPPVSSWVKAMTLSCTPAPSSGRRRSATSPQTPQEWSSATSAAQPRPGNSPIR